MCDIEIELDATELNEFIGRLLADFPHEIGQLSLDLVDVPAELVCFEQGVATGAVLPILLKPSQRLLDLGAAIRARNFDLFVVKGSHADAPS